ncbi:MAG: TIGR04255 family protein [Acidobacteriota bacterium]|jgi:uncharacterized protein (TIGR04255 family)
MSESELKLARAPIVEAVIDIDCDMPPGFDLAKLEGLAREAFGADYPKFRSQFLEHHRVELKADEPTKHSANRALQALQFLHNDEKQLVQVRAQGFSFNRLSPYTSLSDYLLEIQRTWKLFIEIASPVQIRVVRLRYINRILLPLRDELDLDEYLKLGPRLPVEDNLQFAGFVNQHSAVEVKTGHQASVVLASQPPENEKLPVIFDITVGSAGAAEPKNWAWILAQIESLRNLKNRIFRHTLSEKCLNLFQ